MSAYAGSSKKLNDLTDRAALYPLYTSLCTETRFESKNALSADLSTEGRVVGLRWKEL